VSEPLRPLLLILLTVLGTLAVLLVVALVLVRATSELLESVSRRRRAEVRRLILTALLGEPEERTSALAVLRRREGRAWQQVEQQAFAMLPKIKGGSHTALVGLLLSRGAAGRAYDNAAARSLVRRSRGAYQLGALGDRDAVRTLLNLLKDEHFLVRRTAVRALGQIGDPIAVTPLLDAVTADPGLVRDVVAALQRIGPEASPHLRGDLEHLVSARHRGRRGALVATALGLHGDIASATTLVLALVAGAQPALRGAAAEALGEIGVPVAVPALVGALADVDPGVRRQAATALGQVSDTSAVPAIAAVLGSGQHEVDRALAGALLSLGPAGMAALAAHPSPYAREALSIRQIRITA
jgi:HEAT repeat protein